MLVLIICIPQFYTALGDHYKELNTYILIFLICIFVIIGCAIVLFMNRQHRQANIQRLKSEYGIYTLERTRLRRGDRPVSNIELEKLQVNFF